MKQVFSLLIVASLFACSKKTDGFVPSNSIEGKWNWISTYSGWGGLLDTSSGIQQQLDFIDFDSYTWTKNDTIIHSGFYDFQNKHSWFTDKNEWIVTAEGMTTPLILKVSKDTLWLTDEATDGATHRFLKD